MKIVFFTNKCSHGAALLEALKAQKIPLGAILIEKPKMAIRLQNLKKIYRQVGLWELIKIVFREFIASGEVWQKDDFYQKFSFRIIKVENFNCESCLKILTKIKPDLIILGGSRILQLKVLKIPKIGVLNAHPGLLPKYRGIDVIFWAIYYGEPVGVTVHFVDQGIDTGKIIIQKKVKIAAGDNLQTIVIKAEKLAGRLMAQVVRNILQGKKISAIISKSPDQPFSRMPVNLRKQIKR